MIQHEKAASDDSSRIVSEARFANLTIESADEISVIGIDTKITGNITTSGSLIINGSILGNVECSNHCEIHGPIQGDLKTGSLTVFSVIIHGNITCEHNVTIHAGSQVIGDCWNENISLAGQIKGNIYSRGLIHLHSTAEVIGKIAGRRIIIDDGAIIQGNVKITRG